MIEFIIIHVKVLSILALLALITLSSQMVAVMMGYLTLVGLSIAALINYKDSTGLEYKVYRTIHSFPDAFREPISQFNRYYLLMVLGLIAVFCIRFWAIRNIMPGVRKFINKYLKVKLDEPVNRGDGVKITFNAEDHIRRGDTVPHYFVGLGEKRNPILLNEKELSRAVQIVGPPGTGKSVLLQNFTVQAIEKGKACVFVDGKGDMEFIDNLATYFHNAPKRSDFLFFTPLHPDMSHTYNPLASIQDPGELTDLVATGFNLNVPGPGKVYSDTQKAYLLTLFNLFLRTGKKFNFMDVMTFTNYQEARAHVYDLVGDPQLVDDMEHFLGRLKKNHPELLGLTTIIQKLFCSDEVISRIVNTYSSDIVMKDILEQRRFCLFSLSSGKKAETNEALAKMVISDVANAVGERMARSPHLNDFAMLILDEFGQYAPENFDKFISTARGAKVSCLLSHQSNSQLKSKEGVDRLAPIVRECSHTTILFRQGEEADFSAKVLGTRAAVKRTDVIEGDEYLTEKVSDKGSLREVEEFIVHPNKLKRLDVGQIACRIGDAPGQLVSVGMLNIKGRPAELRPQHKPEVEGLNLRQVIMSLRRVPLDADRPAAVESATVALEEQAPSTVQATEDAGVPRKRKTIRIE